VNPTRPRLLASAGPLLRPIRPIQAPARAPAGSGAPSARASEPSGRARGRPSLDTPGRRAHNSSATADPSQKPDYTERAEARRSAADAALTAWLATLGDGSRTAPHADEPSQRRRRARAARRRSRAAIAPPVPLTADATPPVEAGAGLASTYLDPDGAGTFTDPLRALERSIQEGRHQPVDVLAQATPARRVGVLRARALAARAAGSADVAALLDERALEELRALEGRDHDRAWREWSRAEWLEHLEAATRGIRAQRAAYWRSKGQERIAERLLKRGVPEGAAELQAKGHPGTPWHAARARGAAARFEAVRECGLVSALVERCPGCGQRSELRLRCSDRFFCGNCRKSAGRAYRDQFRRQAAGLIQCAEVEGLVYRRDRNRTAAASARGLELLSERLVTFTAPHLEADTVAQRILRMREAWKRFVRVLAADTRRRFRGALVLKTYEGQRMVNRRQLTQWIAVNEWTPGADGKGHPHVHLWHFGAFLPHEWLCEQWAICLQAADGAIARHARDMAERGEVFRPIVDVRAVRGGFVDEVTGAGAKTGKRVKIDREIYKYLTKDWADTDQNRRVDPAVYAEVYAAFLGRRMRQSSAGFRDWSLPKHRECPCCAFQGKWQRGICGLRPALGFDPRKESWERPPDRPPPSAEALAVMAQDASRERELRAEYEARWWSRLEWTDRKRLEGAAAELRAALVGARQQVEHEPLDSQLSMWGAH
jgi:hypothetical protein